MSRLSSLRIQLSWLEVLLPGQTPGGEMVAGVAWEAGLGEGNSALFW